MAKRRKGAKKVSASRSKPSKAKQRKTAKPVSPVPRKRARTSEERASAARRGWETRRRQNPLRWGRAAVAERRKNSRVVDRSTSAIEREWKELERKALRQAKEAERHGGVHPTIASKLSHIERIEAQLADMKTNIRRFNSPTPDKWEMAAYKKLENFITLRDFGASREDTFVIAVGTKVLSKYGEFDTESAAQDVIDMKGIVGARVVQLDGVKTAYQKWYLAKQEAREKSPDWPAWMAMIGSVLGLPMHGSFSVDSFVTS